MKNFSSEIEMVAGIVHAAGRTAYEELGDPDLKVFVKDGVPGGSHHSIGTAVDEKTQTYLLDMYRRLMPGALFLAEEDCKGEDLISNDNLKLVKESELVVIVDSIDGTAAAYRQRWSWSVAVNLIRYGRHCGGAICAPAVRGGFMIRGEIGVGALLEEGNRPSLEVRVSERPVKKSTVIYGVDVHKRHQFKDFVHAVSNAVETVDTAGSCALGVATVASGRAEALVQSQQWPWDWASTAIIEAAGGKVQFYHYREGMIVPMSSPDLPSYNREDRTTKGGLGFIAGASELVDWIFQTLQDTWIIG